MAALFATHTAAANVREATVAGLPTFAGGARAATQEVSRGVAHRLAEVERRLLHQLTLLALTQGPRALG